MRSRAAVAAAPAGSNGAIMAIAEEGVRFRSYIDGGERFMAPETSMAVQAALHSDIALVFDECTPFHVTRDYTARSTERTHRWLERCLDWHEQHGPADQVVYGIVQGGVEQDLRIESAETVAASRCGGIAIGGSLGQDKPQMHEVVGWTTAALERARARAPPPPARHRRHRRPARSASDSGSTRSTARCRPGSRATAWRSCPTRRRAGASIWPRRAGGLAGADHGRLPLPRLQRGLHARLHPLRRKGR